MCHIHKYWWHGTYHVCYLLVSWFCGQLLALYLGVVGLKPWLNGAHSLELIAVCVNVHSDNCSV